MRIMKVGDLVVQLGWEADGAGVVSKIWNAGGERNYVTVHWPDGVVDMSSDDLKVISESR